MKKTPLYPQKVISRSLTKTKPELKTPKKPDMNKELINIRTEKEKINEKIKEIEEKITLAPTLEPIKTPKRTRPHLKNSPQRSFPNEQDLFIRKMQEKRQDSEVKKAQQLENKEIHLKADIEKLNCEKQKILEVFKLEKEKLFWRKMHELEDRKADRIQKDLDYHHLVKNLLKNNQYPVKTPELDKRKQEIVQKKKLYCDYSIRIKYDKLPPEKIISEMLVSEKKNSVEKMALKKLESEKNSPKKLVDLPKKKNIRSITPNQKPNYLIVIFLNFFSFEFILLMKSQFFSIKF